MQPKTETQVSAIMLFFFFEASETWSNQSELAETKRAK